MPPLLLLLLSPVTWSDRLLHPSISFPRRPVELYLRFIDFIFLAGPEYDATHCDRRLFSYASVLRSLVSKDLPSFNTMTT